MFVVDTTADGRRIRFSANLSLLDRAVDETVAFLRTRNATGRLFEVQLLLREALVNAVRHGSRLDPGRTVSLEVATAPDRLHLVIADQGPGFDWRARMADKPSPTATRGRGLCILALYADELAFNEAGNAVRLAKRIPGLRGPASPADRRGQALGEDKHGGDSH